MSTAVNIAGASIAQEQRIETEMLKFFTKLNELEKKDIFSRLEGKNECFYEFGSNKLLVIHNNTRITITINNKKPRGKQWKKELHYWVYNDLLEKNLREFFDNATIIPLPEKKKRVQKKGKRPKRIPVIMNSFKQLNKQIDTQY